jgi:gliding motility-associated-like protein
VSVAPINDAPVAISDAGATDEGEAVLINVVANDTDDGSINTSTVDLDPASVGIQNSLSTPSGLFSVNTSGIVTFSPMANFNGVATINYTVNDNGGLTSNAATITITVNSVNAAPVATDDTITTNEDTSVTLNVTGNDTDDVSLDFTSVDLNTATAGQQNTRTTAQGDYSADATGNVTFTPALNFTGSTSITYSVEDGESATSNVASISISVTPVNDKPVAANDTRITNEDTPATINVVSNDTDVDGVVNPASVDLDPSAAGIQTSHVSAEGTYSVNASGVVTFVPVNNFFGGSTLTYVVSDDQGLISDPATVTLTVTSVNDPPIAANDITSTDQGVAITFSVVANDLDVDGTVNAGTVDLDQSIAGIQQTRTIASGTYTVNAAGVVTFTPVTNFSGTSSITYSVNDNVGTVSNGATISVLVNFVNQKPVANNDAASTTEDTPVTVSILANDTDDGSIITTSVDLNMGTFGVQNTFTTTEGSYTVNNTGVLTFTPVLNFTGNSTISYTVNDNIGETSNAATITIIVSPVNDAPSATNDAASTNEDTNVVINVIANDSDPDGSIDPASVDLLPGTDAIDQTNTVAQGTFTANAATGAVTFSPTANFNGSASTTYNVRDNGGLKSNTATITVTIVNVNDPPSFDLIENQRVLKNSAEKTITITGITPGPSETEPLLITATSQNTTLITHPDVTGGGATATLKFKPQANQSGTAEITVKVVDSGLNEFSRTFTITVVDVDIISTPVTLAIPGEPYEYNITVTDIPETLVLATTVKPAWLTLTSTAKNTATLSGTPLANSTSAPVTLQLKDGAAIIDQQQFTIEINRRPLATPFELQGEEDSPIVVGSEKFLLAFSDPDNHTLTEVQFTTLPKHGSLTIGANAVSAGQMISFESLSTLVFTPAADYSGPDTVYFKVKDPYSYSADMSYFHFVISPVNDAPVIEYIETEPLVYDIGRELAQIFTTEFDAREPENDLITGAIIGFRPPNFDSFHDWLEFSNTSSISGVYDDLTGVLTLTGSASVEEYENAIRSITYTFIDLQDIILDPRTIFVILNDGVSTSEPKERQIKLIYDFVELEIPNVFTPDGSGGGVEGKGNDLWTIRAATGTQQYNDALVRIFDKHGKLVFETIGFDRPWDGTVNGTPVPAETYFYAIDLKYGNVKYTGTVTILRQNP